MSITQDTETALPLKMQGFVILGTDGCGTVSFTPSGPGERLTVTEVHVWTSQDADPAAVPFATLASNATRIESLVLGSSFGTSRTGNDDYWYGTIEVGPEDILSVLFYPPGLTPSEVGELAGVTASAEIIGTRYTS